MIECFLASLSSCREVTRQLELLLGHYRSHESIRHNILYRGRLIIEYEEDKLQRIENLEILEKEAPPVSYT